MKIQIPRFLFTTFFFVVFSFLFSAPLYAQDDPFGLNTTAGGTGLKPSESEDKDATTLINEGVGNIINAALGFLGVLFLILTIYAGVSWMTSAGNEEKIARAKKILLASIIGIAIVVFSFVIIDIIVDILSKTESG